MSKCTGDDVRFHKEETQSVELDICISVIHNSMSLTICIFVIGRALIN